MTSPPNLAQTLKCVGTRAVATGGGMTRLSNLAHTPGSAWTPGTKAIFYLKWLLGFEYVPSMA